MTPSRLGWTICALTSPRMVSEGMPSLRDWANAASRFGPVVPFVPARLSTWQEPHLATKSFLPLVALPAVSLTRQPLRATSSTAATIAGAVRRVLLTSAAWYPRGREEVTPDGPRRRLSLPRPRPPTRSGGRPRRRARRGPPRGGPPGPPARPRCGRPGPPRRG